MATPAKKPKAKAPAKKQSADRGSAIGEFVYGETAYSDVASVGEASDAPARDNYPNEPAAEDLPPGEGPNGSAADEPPDQQTSPDKPAVPVTENDVEEQGVFGSNISDQATKTDSLGFEPYVIALAKFLRNEKTKGPLTMSIEGEWGSGKSSFMLQLGEELKSPKNAEDRDESAKNDPVIIEFNAWRYDKEDAMWAAFALQLIEGLAAQTSWRKKINARLWLLLHQYNWKKGWWDLLLFSLGLIFIVAALTSLTYLLATNSLREIYAVFLGDGAAVNMTSIILSLGGVLGSVITGGAVIWKFRKMFLIPFAVDLRRHIDVPDYKSRGSFIEDFHKDFSNVITAYAGEDKKQDDDKTKPGLFKRLYLSIDDALKVQTPRKVFVFIDDLDRCDIPKSADLMQSLNLMISESPQLFFIMGMDREKVAAGLAVKYEKILPYLAAAPVPQSSAEQQPKGPDYFAGLEYGYNFIEKFIQVPFKVPQPSSENIKSLVDSFSEEEETAAAAGAPQVIPARDLMIVELEKTDSKVVKEIVNMVAATFDHNPRRIKQFLNLFRLKAYIASQTGLFAEPFDVKYKRLTLEKLGKFVALTLRYPLLIADLDDKPDLLSELQYRAWGIAIREDRLASRWAVKSKIIELLGKGFEDARRESLDDDDLPYHGFQPSRNGSERLKFSMTEMDITKLLQVSPAKKRAVRRGAEAAPPAENPVPVAVNPVEEENPTRSGRQERVLKSLDDTDERSLLAEKIDAAVKNILSYPVEKSGIRLSESSQSKSKIRK